MKYIYEPYEGHSSRVPPDQRPKFPPHREQIVCTDPTFANPHQVGILADQIHVPAIRFDPHRERFEYLGGPNVLHDNRRAA